MNWTYVTEILFAKYQLHNTAVGLAFLAILVVIYLKFSITNNDNNHKFNYIGEKLGNLDSRTEKILDKVSEHDTKINNIDTELKMTKTHLEQKWKEFRGHGMQQQEVRNEKKINA